MRLGAPGFLWFLICTALGGLGVAGHFTFIRIVTPYQYWFVVAGWALLTFGCLFRVTRA